MLGLYIHIPFCKKICDYCDFATIQAPERLYVEYLDLLEKEIRCFAARNRAVDARNSAAVFSAVAPPAATPTAAAPCAALSQVETLYLGGGTPSILPPELLDRLFQLLKTAGVPLKTLKEATLEFNPESCTADRLQVALENGITRASLGLQTFRPQLLTAVSRTHSVEQGLAALDLLTKTPNLEVSADLMFNLPGQSQTDFLEDLERLSAFPLNHISFYGLKVDPRSRLGFRIARGELYVDEDLYAPMYREGVDLLANRGFDRYETSNFAKPGHESLHNLNYWQRGEYLAFGPSAHGFYNGVRFSSPEKYAPWRDYVNAGCPTEGLSLDPIGPEERIAEYIQLSLRTKYGLNAATLASYGAKISEKSIVRWESCGFLKRTQNGMVLVNDGWLFMDRVVEDLYSNLE